MILVIESCPILALFEDRALCKIDSFLVRVPSILAKHLTSNFDPPQ